MKCAIDIVLPARESMLPGNFVVFRALPRRELRRVGGFVFLDHFDQPNITPDLFDVPPHPHVGLQTVTYLFHGEILHTDSLEYEQMITPGDVNWMTSGKGITHAEQVIETQPRIHGLQSWVGLPHDQRTIEPAFDHFPKESLPLIEASGTKIRVIAGACGEHISPIPTFQQLIYLDISAEKGSTFSFPVSEMHEHAVYVCEGSVDISGQVISVHDLGKLTPGDTFEFTAIENTRFALFGGEPLPDPTVIYWNFITDTIGEAKQKMIEWEEGKFPAVSKYIKRSSEDNDATMEEMKLL